MVTGNTRVPGARGARARTASKDRIFAAMQRTRAQPRGGPVVGSMQRTSTRLRPWRRGYHVRRKLEQLYDVGEELGHGGYSLVRLSTHKVSGEPLQGPCASMQPSRLAPSGAGRQPSLKYTASPTLCFSHSTAWPRSSMQAYSTQSRRWSWWRSRRRCSRHRCTKFWRWTACATAPGVLHH
jgi:hypothetical protein